MNLNLHLLKIFYTVINQQSFSRAADLLCIGQPAVSKAVKELELQLGLSLIERHRSPSQHKTRVIQLTENGQILFEHARRIFALERAAREEMQARQNYQKGRLTIGASTTIASYWLPSYLAHFRQQFPAIDLTIRVGNTQTISQALIDCEIDIALIEGDVNDQHIQVEIWKQDELKIITAKNHPLSKKIPITVQLLNQQTWLCRESGSGTFSVVDNKMKKLGIQPNSLIEIGSNEGIARAVVANLGIAILPLHVVRDLIELNKLNTIELIDSGKLIRNLYLLHLKERPLSGLVELFYQLLKRN